MTFATGIVAALSAPLTMTLGFILWDNHWKGSAFALNMFKCNLASLGFVVLSVTTRPVNELFPPQIFTTEAVGFLVLSSVVGIVIGDWAWLESLQLLGARRVIIMDSLKPFLAAVFGWALLDEQLQPAALGGMVLTVAGVLLVSLEREGSVEDEHPDEGNNSNHHSAAGNNDHNEAQQLGGDQECGESNGRQVQPPNIEAIETSDCLPIFKEPIHHNGNNATDVSSTALTVALTLEDPSTYSITEGSDSNAVRMSVQPPSVVVEEVPADAASQNTTTTNYNNNEHADTRQLGEVAPAPLSARHTNVRSPQQMRLGYFMSFVNVGLDTWGSVLTKEHGVGMTTWEINLIRFGFAGVVMLFCSLLLRLREAMRAATALHVTTTVSPSWPETREPSTPREAVQASDSMEQVQRDQNNHETPTSSAWYMLPLHGQMSLSSWMSASGGVLFVTFITPALSNFALFQIALALALTLGSVGPLYAMPLSYLLQKDQRAPTLRAYVGALFAVAGIVVLAFCGTLQQGSDS